MADQHEGAWVQRVAALSGSMYRVYFDSFTTEADARAAQDRLWDSGIDSFLRSLQ